MRTRYQRLAGMVLSALLLCLTGAQQAAAQERTVTGRVLAAATEEPLSAAQISVQGTTLGTIADADGRFSLAVPDRDVVLVARLIGYRAQEVPVAAGQGNVTIRMETDVLGLDEIVVTGRATGVQRRNLANAVSTVSGDQLANVPSASMEQQLYGKVAGADIQANSAAPGGGMQIRLRGSSTIIGDHTPLYVVDGVIVSDAVIPSGLHQITVSSADPERGGSQDNSANRIADLNPNDIESIEILKGASAAAIYGSKANNGVVIITTKRGGEGRPRYNLTQRLGFSSLANTIGFRRFNTLEDATAAFGANAANHWEPDKFFDHEKELADHKPFSWETSGSTSGSLGETRYFVSGLAKEDGGLVINTGYNKQSIRLNLNQRVGDRLSLDLNTNAVHANAARGFTQNDNRSISYWMTFPYTPTFVDLRPDADGTYPNNPFSQSNPLQTAALSKNDEIVWRFIGSGSADLDVLTTENQRLRLLGNAGIDYFNQKNEVLTPPELQFEPLDGQPGTSILGTAYSQNINLGLNAVHDYTPGGGNITATTSLGVQYEIRDLDFTRTTGRDLIAGLSNVDKATSIEVYQLRERVEDLGFFVQEEVLVDERLLLTGSVRADRSSNNSDTEKYFVYPKAAASYRFPDLVPGTVDELKLRMAFGTSGNRPRYGQKFSEYLGQNIGGIATLSVQGVTADPELRPERQYEIEGGVDATLFDERATVELTGYQKNVQDVLLERELPTSTGFSTAIFNGGEIRVRGMEAAVTGFPISREGLQWNTRANFSFNRSKIVELNVPPFVTGGFGFLFGSFFAEEGGSMTAIWGNDTLPDGSTETRQIGDSNPDFRAGWSNELTLGDFRLFGLLDWQQGGDVINLTQLLADLAQNAPDYDETVDGESVSARRVRLWPRHTAVYLYDASFLKLRELTLTWNVPEETLGRFLPIARSARLSLSGRDLIRITDYPGMDPEVSNFGSQAIGRNVDVAPYPPSRSFWFSVDLGF